MAESFIAQFKKWFWKWGQKITVKLIVSTSTICQTSCLNTSIFKSQNSIETSIHISFTYQVVSSGYSTKYIPKSGWSRIRVWTRCQSLKHKINAFENDPLLFHLSSLIYVLNKKILQKRRQIKLFPWNKSSVPDQEHYKLSDS